jgi:hypothetical protein
MYMQKKLEFSGASGKTYTFEVYPKSAQLPKTHGIYILTYSHPCGHLSGVRVNTLCMGVANNLNMVIADLRQKGSFLRECWNYTCIMCLDNAVLSREYFEDLHANNSIARFK